MANKRRPGARIVSSSDPSPSPHSVDFPIVGIGASAGGIQALMRLLQGMPADGGMAFVAVLHISPNHASHVDEVLQRSVSMPVVQVFGTTPIEKNTVYLISPSNDLSIADGCLHVAPSDPSRRRPVAIDLFFRSLADAHRARSISIILSGMGSDGAMGIARIKEQNGINIVQDPTDAEFDEMPRNALATGFVDIVLSVERMPARLIELRDNARAMKMLHAVDDPPRAESGIESGIAPSVSNIDADADVLNALLTILRIRTGHDFRHYTRGTVMRRIERRLQVNGVADLAGYKRFIEAHPEETTALLKDMLIGVTNFFRDRKSFDAFEQLVVANLFKRRSLDEPVRAWSAGCSTGEEAYSLAMLLIEHGPAEGKFPLIQVFATDVDASAIDTARAGVYAGSIVADVSPERLSRFFVKPGGRYQVSKELRQKVVFAVHNMLSDPPFSGMDLISCRNLLVYLDRTVQRQVLEMFHFALRPGGFLFLGAAESTEIASDLFGQVDKRNCIYQSKRLGTRAVPPLPLIRSVPFDVPRRPGLGHDAPVSLATLRQRVFERYAPANVTVDRDGVILHMSDRAGRFLQYVSGEPSRNLLTLVNPELRAELRTALHGVLRGGESVVSQRVRFSRGEKQSFVNISVRPFKDDASGHDVIVVFFDEIEDETAVQQGAPVRDFSTDSVKLVDLEQDLYRTQTQMDTLTEDANVFSEELMASNEELQAINEELRSTSEELEAGKAELQSVNAELVTVNLELTDTVAETTKANDDLRNLISSTGIPTVFVDREMRIKRYTPPAVALFKLIPSDIGRPLLDLTHRLDYPQMAADARAAFDTLTLTEREIRTDRGDWFLARVLPYRTADDQIDGAVITLIDITARRTAEAAARSSEERLRLAVATTNDYAIIVLDMDGLIVTWNGGAQRIFGYTEREVQGQPLDLIFLPDDRKAHVPLLERQRATQAGRAEDERWHVRADGTEIYCSGVTTPIESDQFRGYAKIARDVTNKASIESQKQLALALERAIRAQSEAADRVKDEFFSVLSHELKNPLNLIHVKAELLTRIPDVRDISSVQDAADAIQRAVVGQARIIDDSLDLSRVRTGRLALRFAPVEVASLLQAVAAASAADAQAGDIELSIAGTNAAVMIHADAERVEQMVWNLVRNALKFTPCGGRVRIALSRQDGFVCVEVADTGQGIAPAFLPRIFEMFSQADGGGWRDRGGLGIGLSLVKQFAELHGGRIEAESAGPGQGATFRLWLPENAPSAPVETPRECVDRSILKGLRVLLVDDSIDALEAFRTLLEMEGAQVRAEPSAEQALEAATQQEFDVVLSDIGMPAMTGYEMIRQMRKTPRTARLPALALTGFGREQDVTRALDAGFNGHLSKPVSLKGLVAAIDRSLRR
ncbi:Protein-glutamate methylesterase/protein-glutamine glutaminase [Caballeronia sp. SBC1]|uniref:CheR family methyltransferase n=1 Tax=unclassified Caballeronia TaxID=2646786 RepID=UPI0013E1BEA4|nr:MULTISPECIES: CheR family methyltransferase [unclassified Caballeronia]QIE23219.1 Protein-glutamate methylesterase/protein-glutamine glutaminase [Caballeronia sp. SBC2]QIN61112.1 Protein-glutamate methylesterase/protein-glutamine glutaminase [Caballeronia sp. SBC1]